MKRYATRPMEGTGNLPWWRLIHMTKSQAKFYNLNHLKATNMTEQDIEKQVSDVKNRYAREVWNAALDKAAKRCDEVRECVAAARIRELKK